LKKSQRDVVIRDMATALQQAVAMYCLMIDHSQGRTDLTEDQFANVVEGVCEEAGRALEAARLAGLIEPLPVAGAGGPAHGGAVPGPARTVH
jgi:hypothetical protein